MGRGAREGEEPVSQLKWIAYANALHIAAGIEPICDLSHTPVNQGLPCPDCLQQLVANLNSAFETVVAAP